PLSRRDRHAKQQADLVVSSRPAPSRRKRGRSGGMSALYHVACRHGQKGIRMRVPLRWYLFLLCGWAMCQSGAAAHSPRHYLFVNRDREHLSDARFLETKAFEGAQVKYTWRELAPEKDACDFSAIDTDLAFLTAKGKRLFIQLQDSSFGAAVNN